MESNNEPEFWTVLKTPPKTQEELDYEFWKQIIGETRDVYRVTIVDYLTVCK